MKRPSQAWCAQIVITSNCILHCSNCTQSLDHIKRRWFMTLEDVERALLALQDFVTSSERDPRGKVVGCFGGEPLLHPKFPEIVDLFVQHIPNVQNRGLWTSVDWRTWSHPKYGPAKDHVIRLVGPHEANGRGGGQGWLNWNMHLDANNVHHQPVNGLMSDIIPDRKERWDLIENCWLQTKWSPSITYDKDGNLGFYFCEVAGSRDTAFGGVGGLPVHPGCWRGDLDFETTEDGPRQPTGRFADQIKNACERCLVCVPLQGRRDKDDIDDVTEGLLSQLVAIDSPRLKKGRVHVLRGRPGQVTGWNPRQYRRGVTGTE